MTSSHQHFFLYWPLAPIAQYILPSPIYLQTPVLSSPLRVLSSFLLLWATPHPSLSSLQVQLRFLHPRADTTCSVTPGEWLTAALLVLLCTAKVRHGPHPAKRADSTRKSYSEITDLTWIGWLSLTSTHLIQKGNKHFKMYRQVFHFIVCSVNKQLYYYRRQGEGRKKPK